MIIAAELSFQNAVNPASALLRTELMTINRFTLRTALACAAMLSRSKPAFLESALWRKAARTL
jgi:hypothetical protein